MCIKHRPTALKIQSKFRHNESLLRSVSFVFPWSNLDSRPHISCQIYMPGRCSIRGSRTSCRCPEPRFAVETVKRVGCVRHIFDSSHSECDVKYLLCVSVTGHWDSCCVRVDRYIHYAYVTGTAAGLALCRAVLFSRQSWDAIVNLISRVTAVSYTHLTLPTKRIV